MSRGWRIVLTIFAAIVAFDVGAHILNSLTGGSPGGPTSSSYATGTDGLAAYFALLRGDGHPVERLRTYPSLSALPGDATAIVLDPGFVNSADAEALKSFVVRGGRLVTGGAEPAGWLRELLGSPPAWSATSSTHAHPLAPVPELAGVTRLHTGGAGSWSTAGAALPAYGNDKSSVVAVATIGLGRVVMLSDASVLQNAYLGSGDNARFALNVAGSATRPVDFFESYHGYGPSIGYASIPARWIVLLGGLVLAALALMVARGRRLGPPEAEGRELPPPRRAYVDSVAGILARARRPDEALEPIRAETRARIARRAGLPADAASETLEAAARLAGLSEAEIGAMLGRPGNDDAVLSAGRALVHAGRTDTRSDE
jgi:hypothetical protein